MTGRLKFFCPRWGSEGLGWDEFLAQVREAGYNGVEFAVPGDADPADIEAVLEKMERRGLLAILQHYDTREADFGRHRRAFEQWFAKVAPFSPYKLNSQTGRDIFSFEENLTLIELAGAFGQSRGVAVLHETHRGKFSFAAHVTRPYLQALPGLQITLDASHWVCVAESYLEDQAEAVELALSRTEHIHARVGHPEGPQVTDPRAPEWRPALEMHMRWWDRVAERKRARGEELSVTMEFGPAPYLVHLPFTNQPITSQWEVNAELMRLLRERLGRP